MESHHASHSRSSSVKCVRLARWTRFSCAFGMRYQPQPQYLVVLDRRIHSILRFSPNRTSLSPCAVPLRARLSAETWPNSAEAEKLKRGGWVAPGDLNARQGRAMSRSAALSHVLMRMVMLLSESPEVTT